MQFEFEKFDKIDGRSVFANRVLNLLYQKHEGNLDNAIVEGEKLFTEFDYFVRNIYELVDTEIPLMAYYELKKYGADNWGFNSEEYNNALENTIDACKKYYK